jgi:uncharacterized protein
MRAVIVGFRAALALLLVITVGSIGFARADGFDSLRVLTASGAHDFQVEIVNTDESREIGLMNRRYMGRDHGMLFEFDTVAPQTFWMKNTYIPLDMVFISRAGVVTRVVANAEPLSEAIIPSGGPCAAVLELNGGVAAAIGLKVGDRISHPFFKA